MARCTSSPSPGGRHVPESSIAPRSTRTTPRALALSRGTRAALFVAYAEAVAVREQDRVLFESLLARALAVDPEARPQEQLQNALAKRRAQWLAARADRLFVE